MRKLPFIVLMVCILATLTVASLLYREYKQRQARSKPAPVVVAEDRQITLLEGWTLHDIAVYLEKQNVVGSQDFLSYAATFSTEGYPLVDRRPKNASLEGYVFPDTYRIPKISQSPTSAPVVSEAVLKRALNNFENKFTDEMTQQAATMGLSVHEAVILASIIENETGRNAVSSAQKQQLDQERSIVSGIFHNRLRIGMALESDATVNYVTGKNDPAVSLEDTKVQSPYNTYQNRGLPPGPISSPSLSSLKAALYPQQTDYLYFLHKQPSGEPVYSKTFEEHVQNKYKYLK